MELVVFDLDGTLLNKTAEISAYTRETLELLRARGIAYTVATGRALHATRELLQGNNFVLPQIYKNGVMTWRPDIQQYSHHHLLTQSEISAVLRAFLARDVAPFIFTVEADSAHVVYHPPFFNDIERRLEEDFRKKRGLTVLPLAQLPDDACISNISALGDRAAVEAVSALVVGEEHLVAYMGDTLQIENVCWIDVHHSAGSKGNAVSQLKADLGLSQVICFGDSDNDLSMFALADEAYAPENARDDVKAAATRVIGHHDEEGIAHFLRERFSL